ATSRADRRSFLKSLGCLTVGIPFLASCEVSPLGEVVEVNLPGSLKRHPGLDAWIQVLADSRIRVFSGKIELGQGIGTVIQQVAAEELRTNMSQVEVVLADTGRTPNEGYTAGSGSVKGSAMAVRYAAATAREKLYQLAAEQWQVDAKDVILQDGIVSTKNDTKSRSIGDILQGRKWEVEVVLPVPLVPKDQYQYVGKSVARMDLDKIVAGASYFIQDLNFPGMLHARVLRPPTYRATLESFDVESVKGQLASGVDLIADGNFVAITGTDEFEVVKNVERLSRLVDWKLNKELVEEELLKEQLPGLSTESEMVLEEGPIEDGSADIKIFKGSFYKPYIMHGAIGPACAVAYFQDGKLEVWTHSQGVYPLRSALASMLSLEEDNIHVTGVPGAGCFGHNSADDAAADAAIIAREKPDTHIRVQWSRNQEHQWEALGSAMRIDIETGLRSGREIAYWKSELWTDSHSTRPNSDAGTLITARYLNNPVALQGRGYLGGGHRNAEPYYNIGAKRIQAHYFKGPLRVSSLRSLGAYANAFAIESMMDEMSYHENIHPIDFRIRLLNDPRAIAVLKELKTKTENVSAGDREGLGYAFCRYKNNDAYCAVAALVSLADGEKIRIRKMWATLDAGEVINLDGLINQTEGGMIQAASWTMREQVRFDRQHITADNWANYPIFRFQDVPDVEVTLIQRPEEPVLGGGEAAQPPTPAAITNAIFRATGKRIYDLPVERMNLKEFL
ncbi:MAG: molybdopterin-dependent oxidoreductase, partial [Saprospiraceae bacterium]|nr:molybdopterin-dependent oxidoreductase [Saprospiraceae bacterium]